METLKLDVSNTPSLPVELQTPTGLQKFEIREMSALHRGKHLDAMRERMEFDSAGKAIAMKKFDGFQADLVSRCLFREDGKAVPLQDIQAWPASTVQALYDAAHKLNKLGKDAEPEQEAKNG